MSQFTEREVQLVAAVVKNFDGNISASVNWDQAARDAGYKDSRNAKTMWSRLAKKFTEAAAATAPPANDDNAGESSGTITVKAGRKRKAAGNPQADSSPAKVGRSNKKAKGSEGSSNKRKAEKEAAGANAEGQSSEAETLIKQEDKEEAA